MRDVFFDQCGPTSVSAKRLNTLASEFGCLLSRQSDRDMPKTKFSGGICRGKLMAKEYTGIILVLLITIKSPRGQEIMKHRNTHGAIDPCSQKLRGFDILRSKEE